MHLFWILLLLIPQVAWAKVTAWVDRNPVVLGETFQLYIEAEDLSGEAEPNLSVLQHFDVLGSSVQSNTSIINSSIRQSRRWTYTLLPRKAGKVNIPPVPVGPEQSNPLALEVRDLPTGGKPEDQVVWMEGELSKRLAYPGEEVQLVVRILRTVEAENESLSPFEPTGADVERYDQVTRIEVRNGIRVKVTEFRYSIFPQQPGVLELPELRYQGDVPQGRARDPLDPFQLMRRGGKRIYRQLAFEQVAVQPLPPGESGWWLPARSLKVISSWMPDPPEFRAGEPVTWTLQIQATGVRPSQLPELQPQLPEGLKAYPEQPQFDLLRENDGIHAYRTQAMAVIPSQAGTYVIPEQQIRWWNVVQNQVEKVRIPEQRITVQPAEQPEASLSPAAPRTEELSAEIQPTPNLERGGSEWWRWGTWGFATLWILTLGLWFFSLRRVVPDTEEGQAPAELREVWRQLRQACRSQEARQTRRLLGLWVGLYFPELPPTLETLARQAPELRNELQNLEAACYGPQSVAWSGEPLLKKLQGLQLRSPAAPKTPLPKLYA